MPPSRLERRWYKSRVFVHACKEKCSAKHGSDKIDPVTKPSTYTCTYTETFPDVQSVNLADIAAPASLSAVSNITLTKTTTR